MGIWKLKRLSCLAFWSAIALLKIGASLTFSTAIAKISLADVPALSVAVTLTFRLPTLSLLGVPLKVRVVELKVNQLGKASPFSNVAE